MAAQNTVECKNIPEDEGVKFVDALKDGGIAGITKYAKERLDEWRHIPLDIAVTGKSGAGKSSYINAIRGLKFGEEGAAETDVVEATREIRSYEHPSNKNIVFWDLPGVGTDKYKREDYYKKVNLPKYDFFLIISSERFSENDGWLADEIKRMKKRFYFIRTKVQNAIDDEPRSRVKPRPKKEILDTIRVNCQQSLELHCISDSDIYLIDNFKIEDFDFSKLQAQLIEDAPKMKREVLVFSIMGKTDSIISQKKKALEERIPGIALASAVAGAIPFPGVGFTVDTILMTREAMFYQEQFGLTEDALKNSAEILDLSEEELKRQLDLKAFLLNCTHKGMVALCREVVAEATEQAFKYALPIIGSTVSGVISYKTTSYCLRKLLEEIYEDSMKINEKIRKHLAESTPIN